MPESRILPQQSPAMPIARILRIVLTIATAVCAAFVFYALGLSAKPHRLGIATVMTCIYLVVIGGGNLLIYRAWMKRARALAAKDPQGPR